MRRELKSIAVLGGLALFLASAGAIDLFDAIPLPDDGFGSRANGIYYDLQEDVSQVVGQKMDMFGRTVPMEWDLNNDGTVVASTQLPLPPGFQGGCYGGMEFMNGDHVIVGNLTDNAGRTHAVLWRKPLMGEW